MTMGVERTQEEVEAYKKVIVDYLLKQPGGTFAAACNHSKIPYSTAYEWRKNDPQFDEDVITCRKISDDQGGDLAESKLMKKINDEDTTSIIFYLKTKHKSRGYVERQEQTGANGAPIKTESSIDAISLDILRRYLDKQDSLEKK